MREKLLTSVSKLMAQEAQVMEDLGHAAEVEVEVEAEVPAEAVVTHLGGAEGHHATHHAIVDPVLVLEC